MFNLTLICGGPSPERGISLNSVRSFYDNIPKYEDINIKVIFIDLNLNKYFVDETFLYSNTTSDFDFKLATERKALSEEEFINALKQSDLVMPVIHGAFGEDGTIQKIFEEYSIPYVASGSKACEKMYNKANAEIQLLRKYNLKTIPKLILNKKDTNVSEKIKDFYCKYNLNRTVIKPIKGGSSFGVELAENCEDCISKAIESIEHYHDILIEMFCEGREFTVIILENNENDPVALIPTEIEIKKNADSLIARDSKQQMEKEDVNENIFFTTRRKYLPTNETHYYNPPRFSKEIIQKIRSEAERLFRLANAKDFLRIDGWLLENDEIYFSDFNPISGMEQNSFLFQQGARVGMSHKEILEYILRTSSERQGLKFPIQKKGLKKRVNVLLGGITSERQVSLMSGSNVWLKLLNSEHYDPKPYLLTQENGEFKVLALSYDIILNHTVEEIIYQNKVKKDTPKDLVFEIREKLGIQENSNEFITLPQFIKNCKNQDAYVFLGLHGGFGENGKLQKMLEDANLSFNGSGSKASEICMDKFETGKLVDSLKLTGLRTARKTSVDIEFLKDIVKNGKSKEYFENLTKEFGADKIIVKPRKDGCSTGVVILTSVDEFDRYINFFINKIDIAPAGSFVKHSGPITLGVHNTEILFEEYIEVDKISILGNKIVYKAPVKWVELTIGVLEHNKIYHALNPSITIASSGVLSLEEKFQGGTGVNITPPPEYILKHDVVEKLKKYMEILCETVHIKDYCRIDVFANNTTGEIIVIEINTLPALSSSTVLFQQGGKETPALSPLKLLEGIISNYKD